MLHGILEQNQVHDSVDIVVLSETELESFAQDFQTWELVVLLLIERLNEVGEHQWLWVLGLEEFGHASSCLGE